MTCAIGDRDKQGGKVIFSQFLRATLDYDFAEEKKFSYQNLSMDEIIHHLAAFLSGLWQIHVFEEGTTRTTAVFFIKYLSTLGFDVTNDIFAKNAWYFRNSLVRANYNDLKNGIHETTKYLELFLRNLLLNENHATDFSLAVRQLQEFQFLKFRKMPVLAANGYISRRILF